MINMRQQMFPLASAGLLLVFSLLSACGGGGSSGNVGPQVDSVEPADGEINIPPDPNIQAHFTHDMTASSITNSSFTLSEHGQTIPAVVSFSISDNIAVLKPDADLKILTEYHAQLDNSITDTSGIPLPLTNWQFTTRDGTWGGTEEHIDNYLGGVGPPDIGIDSNGNALAVWAQDDGIRHNIWSNRYTRGAGWGSPELLETQTGDTQLYPQIAVAVNSYAIAAWVQSDGTHDNVWANQYIPGSGWQTAQLIGSDVETLTSLYSVRVSIDPAGNAMAIWQHGGDIVADYFLVSSGWQTPETVENKIGTASAPDIGMDAAGHALAVWSQNEGSIKNIWSNRFDPVSGWGTEASIESTDAGDALFPQLSVNPDGNAMVLWREDDGAGPLPKNLYSNYYTPTGGWEPEVLVETGSGDIGQYQAALDINGNTLASWTQSDGTNINAYANHYVAGSGWEGAELIEHDDFGDVLFYPPAIVLDDNGNGIVGWTQDDGTPRFNVLVNRYIAGSGWGTAQSIETGSINDIAPAIAMDHNGRAIAVWVQDDGIQGDMVANRFE
jgi:hypothetical protein